MKSFFIIRLPNNSNKPLQRACLLIQQVFLGLIYFFLGSLTIHAQTSMSEYQVKALFLLNFVKYVDWPGEANGPLVIGILGSDSNLDEPLKEAVEGKKINGREITIKHISEDENPNGCGILFIGSTENSYLGDVLSKCSESPILTVGEGPSFLQKGGVINFILRDGKIHLEINLKMARQVNLHLSSKLLSVADSVKE